MASRRRLDISSLLCDNEQTSTSPSTPVSASTIGQISRSPELSPQDQQQQHQRQLLGPQPNPFAPTSGPYISPQHEHFEGRRWEGRPRPTYRESPGSLPSATALTPLVLQPSPARRWTPPPPVTLPPASPVDYTNTERSYLGRRSEELHGSGFPRPQHYSTHPHPYTQYPPPDSSTSPVNVHRLDNARRASIELRSNQFSPTLPPHLSPSSSSLPSKFSSTVHSFSVSPTDLSHSARPSASSSSDRYSQHSPILPRLPEARTFPTQRASASPTVPMSGLSGLDVLVQAATEERERIDVHRRYSGGDEPQPSFSHNAFQRTSLSPVGHRNDMRLQAAPPSPPYTASFGTNSHIPIEEKGAYYDGSLHEEDERAVKRRRSSHGPSYSQELDISQALEHTRAELPLLGSGLGRRSHSLDAHRDKNEYRHDGMSPISHPPSSSSSRVHVSKPGSQYAQSSSARTTTHPIVSEESHASTSSRHSHPLTPVEPALIPRARRSPPRSKPRPKKPGSAALAMMEKEFREVVLSTSGRMSAEDHDSPRKSVTKPGSAWAQTHVKPPGLNSRSRQSNERGAADDEDVDDFFLSTFESPRPAEKQIPSRDRSSAVAPSPETGKDVYLAAQRSHGHQRHLIPSHTASLSSKLRSPGTEHLSDTLEVFSPIRPANEPASEGLMSEVEAEILDEIADAAGAAASEDERTEFDDQETDNMEVDVENELLSLIDGPSEHDSKPHYPLGPSSSYTHKSLTSIQHADFDRMSMPPPDAFKGSQTKGSKKGSSKPKAKEKAVSTAMSDNAIPPQSDTMEDKPSKSKSSAKSRPKKDTPSEKAKAAKGLKGPATPTSATLPTSSINSPNLNTPTDEAFPTVTSSGRMITKSKKSAAAASTDPVKQSSSSHHKKKPAIAGSGNATPRSRSHSVMPRASVDPEVRREKGPKDEQEKSKDGAAEDAESMDKDKLYCVCRTPYDDDRVMIACDRCDEWYHTQCVNMPDALIDLVDQFICSNCIAQNPSLNLRTTYKQRCFAGLKHPNPDSPDACHKSSRGVYSKYCSDECGVRFMHRNIGAWANNGGDIRGLWESVKDAKRREGFVTSEPGRTLPKAILAEIQNNMLPKPEVDVSEIKQGLPDEEGRGNIVAKLEDQLQMVVREREELKKELEIVACRERLLQLASDRAEGIGGCGWDQRLVYGDEEWLEFGADVLDSYEDTIPNGHSGENGDMDVDGQAPACEWWCTGKKKCERHMGWQRVRAADIEKEKITKESALADLTRREREIRSQIEDVLHPQSRSVGLSFPESTFNFKFANGGLEDGMKRTKKKSAEAA